MSQSGDRDRLREAGRYLQPSRQMTLGIMALALAAMGPWLGWWTLLPLAATAIVYKIGDAVTERVSRPEVAIFIAWCASEVIVASSVQLSGGITVPTACWIALPMVTLSYRFTLRGVIAGSVFAMLMLLSLALLDVQAVIKYPPVLIAPCVLLIGTTILSLAILNADQRVRRDAVVDSLTGLLNRKALNSRVDELRQQVAVTGRPVALLLLDVDHFKRVNDTHGHAVGDDVLADLAAELRRNLRAFDLAYRVGGEEMLVVLPGSTIDEAELLATRLRRAIEQAELGGLSVTVSIGVSASEIGGQFEYRKLFDEADDALYEAKSMGRNRVRVSRGPAEPQRLVSVA